MAVDESGDVTVFRVDKDSAEIVADDQVGKFYAGDIYAVIPSVSVNAVIYLWVGNESPLADQDETIIASILPLPDGLESAPMMKIKQGSEPVAFRQLFSTSATTPTPIIVYSSGAGSGQFASAKDTANPFTADRQIFHVRGVDEGAPYAVSIEKKAGNINGEDCFILFMDSLSFLWIGKKSSEEARAVGRQISGILSGDASATLEMHEGEEMDDFWEQLGGKGQDYPEKRPSMPVKGEAKLYQFGEGEEEFVELPAVERGEDMKKEESDAVFVLDTDDSVFVWLGEKAAEPSLAKSIQMGQKFKGTHAGNFGTDVPVVVVKAGHEHTMFTSHFKNWSVEEPTVAEEEPETPTAVEEEKEEAKEEAVAEEPKIEETEAVEEEKTLEEETTDGKDKEEPEVPATTTGEAEQKPTEDEDEAAVVTDEEEEDRAEEEILAGEAKVDAEAVKKAEEEKAATEAAEKERLAKEAEEKAAEEKRLAEEKEAEEKRLAEEKAAEEKRLAEEKAAEEKRLAEEKAAEEKRLAEEKAAEEKRLAEEKAAEEKRLAEEKVAAEKRLAEQKAAEEKRLAEEKAAKEKRLADQKRLEEAKKKAQAEEEEEKQTLEAEAAKNAKNKSEPGKTQIKIEFSPDVKSSLEKSNGSNGRPPLSPEEKKKREKELLKERSRAYMCRTKPLHEQKNKSHYYSPLFFTCDDDLSVSLPQKDLLSMSQKITTFYSITDLREKKEGVDFKHREMYLSDDDFETTFEMSKEEFYDLPKWKRENSKRQAGIF